MRRDMFGFHKKNLVGLDIDTLAVRMVQLRRDDAGYEVTGDACVTEVAPWGEDPQLGKIHTIRARSNSKASPVPPRRQAGRLRAAGPRGGCSRVRVPHAARRRDRLCGRPRSLPDLPVQHGREHLITR